MCLLGSLGEKESSGFALAQTMTQWSLSRAQLSVSTSI